MPAARFMAMTRTLLQAAAHRGIAPGDCLAEVNSNLYRNNESGGFATLFFGLLDVRTGRLAYSNGGHPSPMLLSPGEPPRPLAGTSDTVLGVMDALSYETRNAELRPEEGLLLYTDGVTYAADESGRMFTEARLEATLRSEMKNSAEKVVESILGAVRRFIGNTPQSDDITALAVQHRGCAEHCGTALRESMVR